MHSCSPTVQLLLSLSVLYSNGTWYCSAFTHIMVHGPWSMVHGPWSGPGPASASGRVPLLCHCCECGLFPPNKVRFPAKCQITATLGCRVESSGWTSAALSRQISSLWLAGGFALCFLLFAFCFGFGLWTSDFGR